MAFTARSRRSTRSPPSVASTTWSRAPARAEPRSRSTAACSGHRRRAPSARWCWTCTSCSRERRCARVSARSRSGSPTTTPVSCATPRASRRPRESCSSASPASSCSSCRSRPAPAAGPRASTGSPSLRRQQRSATARLRRVVAAGADLVVSADHTCIGQLERHLREAGQPAGRASPDRGAGALDRGGPARRGYRSLTERGSPSRRASRCRC